MDADDFGILIEREDVLPELVVEENTKMLRLFDWQRRGIEFFWKNGCRAIYAVSSGSGKTIFTIELLKQIFDKSPESRALIMVPKNIILEDTWYKTLIEMGYGLRDVGIFYAGIREYAKITLTNMQNIQDVDLRKFDIFVTDELHNYGSKRLLKILKSETFKYMIGLSATIERYDMKHYDLYKLFNYNIFTYSPEEALNDGILNSFDFIDIAVDMDEESKKDYDAITQRLNTLVQSAGGSIRSALRTDSPVRMQVFGLLNNRKDMVANYPRKLDIVRAICERHADDKVIVFNEYNKQTEAMYWHLLDSNIRSCTMHSGVSADKRRENIRGFRDGRYQTMLASKVLDEGWNFPACDVAVIAAGGASVRQTIQRMGRVLRRKKKKSVLYQLFIFDTIEQKHAEDRAKMLRMLSSDFKEYHVGTEDDLGTMWGY